MTSTIISVGKGGYRTDAVIDSTKNFTPETGCQSDDGGAACLSVPPGGMTQNSPSPYPTNFWLSQVVLPPDSNSGFNAAFYPLPQTFQFTSESFQDLTGSTPNPIRNGINLMAALLTTNQAIPNLQGINLEATVYPQQPLIQAQGNGGLMASANIASADIDGVMNALFNKGYLTNEVSSQGHPESGVIDVTKFTPNKPGFQFDLPGYSHYNVQVEN